MDEFQSLSHTAWDCKYHVIFIPKCRRRTLYRQLRQYLGEVFKKLAAQKESNIEEGHLLPDHVHMMIAIPPKYSVSQVVGFIKGKSAIHLARVYGERKRNFVGQHFWARGYFVSTVGRDETLIREYIRNQELQHQRDIQVLQEQVSSIKGASTSDPSSRISASSTIAQDPAVRALSLTPSNIITRDLRASALRLPSYHRKSSRIH